MNLAEELLTAAGLVKDKTFKETRFLTTPKKTFAIWTDEEAADGPDLSDRIIRHSYGIQLYTYNQDRKIETLLQNEMISRGIKFTKFAREWLTDEQFFMTAFYFNEVEKL